MKVRDVVLHRIEITAKAACVAEMNRETFGVVIIASCRVVTRSVWSGDVSGNRPRWRLGSKIRRQHLKF